MPIFSWYFLLPVSSMHVHETILCTWHCTMASHSRHEQNTLILRSNVVQESSLQLMGKILISFCFRQWTNVIWSLPDCIQLLLGYYQRTKTLKASEYRPVKTTSCCWHQENWGKVNLVDFTSIAIASFVLLQTSPVRILSYAFISWGLHSLFVTQTQWFPKQFKICTNSPLHKPSSSEKLTVWHHVNP